MKKIILSIAAIVLAVFSTNAQVKKYTYDLSPFTGIDVSGDFEVSVVKGNLYSVVISVDEPLKDYVLCGVNGNVLTIGINDKKIPADVKKQFKGKGTSEPTYRATITIPGSLIAVKLSDKALLYEAEDVISSETVDFKLEGNATVKSVEFEARNVTLNAEKKASASMIVKCDNLALDGSGSSLINLKGAADKVDMNVQGSAIMNVDGKFDTSKITIKGMNSKANLAGSVKNGEYNCSGSSTVDASMLKCENAVVKMSGACTLNHAACDKLSVDLSGGATLVFDGDPVVRVERIKSSTMTRTK